MATVRDNLVKKQIVDKNGKRTHVWVKLNDDDNTKANNNKENPEYWVGKKVTHNRFGSGVVVEYNDSKHVYTIHFKNEGDKLLLLNFVKLKDENGSEITLPKRNFSETKHELQSIKPIVENTKREGSVTNVVGNVRLRTSRSDYEMQGASNNYMAATSNPDLVTDDFIIGKLKKFSKYKELFGAKKLTINDVDSPLAVMSKEWHHYGDKFKKEYFFDREKVEQFLNDKKKVELFLHKVYDDRIAKEKKAKEDSKPKYYKNSKVTIGSYDKMGRRFKYKEDVYDNVFVKKEGNALTVITNQGDVVYDSLNKKNTRVDFGKEVVRDVFQEKMPK